MVRQNSSTFIVNEIKPIEEGGVAGRDMVWVGGLAEVGSAPRTARILFLLLK
jgi:hypothetical protein